MTIERVDPREMVWVSARVPVSWIRPQIQRYHAGSQCRLAPSIRR